MTRRIAERSFPRLVLGDMIVARARDRVGATLERTPGGRSVAENVIAAPEEITSHAEESTLFAILVALSVSHLLNDMIQSLIPAIYPILKASFRLSFSQIGLITLTFQLTASLLQPVVGLYTDRYPKPYSLAIGMGFSLVGLLLLSVAGELPHDPRRRGIGGGGVVGLPPGVVPDGTRRLGGRHGLAQSLFQVGGNAGSAIGPLLAAFIVVPRGQASIAWFSIVALVAITVLFHVGRWYRGHLSNRPAKAGAGAGEAAPALSRAPGRLQHRHPDVPGLLEVHLPGEPEQLLHLLPHRQVRRVGAGRAGLSLRLPGRRRGGDHRRRPDRRPLRLQVRHLGVRSWGCCRSP